MTTNTEICTRNQLVPCNIKYDMDTFRDGQFRIPNPKDSNPKLSESNNRIRFISCVQALSRCLVTDFLFVKVSITCSVPSKILVSV